MLVDDDVRAPYETDWTRRWSGRAAAVVRPGTAEEVAAVLRACGEHGAAVVPQGGNTGMVGAGVPRGGEVVLSLTRFTELGEVDAGSMQVSAGAGVTLGALQAHARAAGLDAGVDFAARDSATLGGLVACDAGRDAGGAPRDRAGARRRASRRCSPTARVVRRMSGLLKDNAGYDLPALLIGSEGTLGVITARPLAARGPQRRPGARARPARRARRTPRRCCAPCARGCPRSTPASSSPTRGSRWCSSTWACRRPSSGARPPTC